MSDTPIQNGDKSLKFKSRLKDFLHLVGGLMLLYIVFGAMPTILLIGYWHDINVEVLKIVSRQKEEYLTKVLNESKLGFRRSAAAELLGESGSDRTVSYLINALEDQDADVRKKAAEALGKIGDPTALENLIVLLSDEDSDVRAWVASSLGEFNDNRAVEHLILSLKDTNELVRCFAAYSLGNLRDTRATIPLCKILEDKKADVRIAAIYALEDIGDKKAAEPLIETLKYGYPKHTRKLAAKALGTIGDVQAVEPLISIIKENWKNTSLYRAAISALENIDDERAIEPFRMAIDEESQNHSILYSDDICEAAARALDRMGSLGEDAETVSKAYMYFINEGKHEDLLIKALNIYGTSTMAMDYLNCGNQRLSSAAEEWAYRNGYSITRTRGATDARWGSRSKSTSL